MTLSTITNKIKSLFSKYFAVVIVLVIIIILLLGYILFVKDTLSKIQKIGSQDLKSKQEELQVKSETVERLKALETRYQKVSDDALKQMSYLLPKQSDIPYLVIELKEFVKKNNLSLVTLDVGALGDLAAAPTNATAGGVNTLTITLTVSRLESYSGLKTFLDEVSNNLPLLELSSLAYSPGADTYTLNLTTYYQ